MANSYYRQLLDECIGKYRRLQGGIPSLERYTIVGGGVKGWVSLPDRCRYGSLMWYVAVELCYRMAYLTAHSMERVVGSFLPVSISVDFLSDIPRARGGTPCTLEWMAEPAALDFTSAISDHVLSSSGLLQIRVRVSIGEHTVFLARVTFIKCGDNPGEARQLDQSDRAQRVFDSWSSPSNLWLPSHHSGWMDGRIKGASHLQSGTVVAPAAAFTEKVFLSAAGDVDGRQHEALREGCKMIQFGYDFREPVNTGRAELQGVVVSKDSALCRTSMAIIQGDMIIGHSTSILTVYQR